MVTLATLAGVVLGPGWIAAQDAEPGAQARGREADAKAAPAEKATKPGPISEFKLNRNLPTKPTPRRAPGPNWVVVDASPLPKDQEPIGGLWILDFAFKPLRMIDVEIPGKGRRKVHYLYYRVINRTGTPQRFVPQFTLVTDDRRRYEDAVLPQAVKNIQSREDAATELLDAVTVVGMIPPSTRQGVDDAAYGVAIWDDLDYKADAFQIYVRGLSNAYQEAKTPDGKPYIRYKALRIDFTRPGDERDPNEREIRLVDPPYEWVYYP